MSDMTGTWVNMGNKLPLGVLPTQYRGESKPMSYTESKIEQIEQTVSKQGQGMDTLLYLNLVMFVVMCVLWLWNRISISGMRGKFNRIQEIRSWTR